MADKHQAEEEEARRRDTVEETASEEEEEEENAMEDAATTTSSEEEFEMRIVQRGTAPAATTSDDAQSVSDDASSAVETETERGGNKCSFCSSRKTKACSNLACKRCCVRMDQECAVHSKGNEPKPKGKASVEAASVELPVRKVRKPVFKNEFKESSVMYYGETVTLFCVRDFFQAKQLSQSLLNDQTRRLRASAAATPVNADGQPKKIEKKRPAGGLEAKARVLDALRADGDVKRRKVVSPGH